MTRLLGLACLFCLAVAPNAGAFSVWPSLVLGAAGVDDGFSPVADVYAIKAENSLDQGIIAIGLDFTPEDFGVSTFLVVEGGFLYPSDLAFQGVLPEFRGFPIVDSFVVLPEGLDPLAATAVFEPTRIFANYTTAGGTLVMPGSSATIAHVSVPAGEIPSLPNRLGSVVFADTVTTACLGCIPEPSSALLAGLALAGLSILRGGKR